MHFPKIDQPKKYISWEETDVLIGKLAKIIPDNKLIYGIPRGGHIVAGLLSHHRKDLKISDNPFIYEKAYNTENIIILDDIHDSGKTLFHYKSWGFSVFTLFWRKKEEGNKPDGYVLEVKDEWVVFPWEKD